MSERIWLYTFSKTLNTEQLQQLTENCNSFVSGWTAHEVKLTASFEIYKKQILIIKVDETAYNASGCSIDKLHRFIKDQETQFGIELLNRLMVAYEVNEEPVIVHATKIKDLLSSGAIHENTLVFDNTITSSLQWSKWKKPLKNTWLNKYLSA